MLALAITVSVLILIALLRFGVIVEYSEAGFQVWAKAGFFKRLLLGEGVTKKTKKKKPKEKDKLLEFKPGNIGIFIDILKAVLNALSRLKRRLLIKQLTLYYTSAGEDPANTALYFGAANAVSAAILPGLKRNFRIRRIDVQTWFDFTGNKQGVYAKIAVSIAAWEIIYVLVALFPIIKAIFKAQPKRETETHSKSVRKDGQEYGKSPDQRIDGNNDAENEGDDRC